ncbi:MAG: hypothetical protein M5R42_01510 [Rhodocyclaceae bacterium]|nr:hypothetical protein [Rhodocyclaceae bacterium]
MVQDIRSEEVNAMPKNIPANTIRLRQGAWSSRGRTVFAGGQGQRRGIRPLPDL